MRSFIVAAALLGSASVHCALADEPPGTPPATTAGPTSAPSAQLPWIPIVLDAQKATEFATFINEEIPAFWGKKIMNWLMTQETAARAAQEKTSPK
jgi:hypothetical protein